MLKYNTLSALPTKGIGLHLTCLFIPVLKNYSQHFDYYYCCFCTVLVVVGFHDVFDVEFQDHLLEGVEVRSHQLLFH